MCVQLEYGSKNWIKFEYITQLVCAKHLEIIQYAYYVYMESLNKTLIKQGRILYFCGCVPLLPIGCTQFHV